MRLHLLMLHVSLLAACHDSAADADDADDAATISTSSTRSTTTDAAPTTSSALDPGSTSAEPSDTTTTTTDASESSSTGDEPLEHCVEHPTANACQLDPRCRWKSIFQFTHGVQGCQGDVIELCVGEAAGAPSTWYRGDDESRVLQFDHTPDDLPPEWRRCDCDGPLACFCASDAPDCPNRLADFCAASISKFSCTNAAIHGELRCGWFRVSPEGPPDDKCSQQVARDVCLPATNPTADTCTKFTPPYPQCSSPGAPVYHREVDGVIQVTASCGPIPSNWTACSELDTPEQPDECGCLCL